MHMISSPAECGRRSVAPFLHAVARQRLALTIAFCLCAGAAGAEEIQARTDATDAKTLDQVQVVGQRVRAQSGALGERSALNTPFSISVVSGEEIRDRQAASVETVFIADPSVTVNSPVYTSVHGVGMGVNVRGLPLKYWESYKVNGLPISTYSGGLPYEAFEQVELLKGLSGFMYGFAAPGGIVNHVTKKPTDEFLLRVGAGFRSDSIYSVDLDTGGRFGQGDRFGYRFNAVREEGDTHNDDGRIERNTFAVSLDSRLAPGVELTADLFYNKRDVAATTSSLGTTAYEDALLPPALDGSRNLGPRGAFENGESLFAAAGVRWQLGEHWQAKFDFAHTESNTRWARALVDLLNLEGDYEAYIYDQAFDEHFDTVQAILQGGFQTGAVRHDLVAGASWQRERSATSDGSVYESIGTSNLFDPVPLEYVTPGVPDPGTPDQVEQSALFLSDTMSLSPHWSLVAGLRYIEYDSLNAWSGAYSDNVVTPTVALIWKPAEQISVYASYVESLESGSTVGPDYANAFELLPPLESKQYEIGAKFEQARWNAGVSLFRIERGAEYIDSANYYVQDGQLRFQGVEFQGGFRATDNLAFHAGALWLDATYEETEPALQGNRVEDAPRFQATAGFNYALPFLPGLSLYSDVKRFGKKMVDSYNTWELPAYTLADAGLRYRGTFHGHEWTLRGSVTNLTGRRYWAAAGWGDLRIGEPRSVAVSVQVDL